MFSATFYQTLIFEGDRMFFLNPSFYYSFLRWLWNLPVPLVFDYKDGLESSIEGEAEDDEPIKITGQAAPIGNITLNHDCVFAHVTVEELENVRINQ